MDKEKYLSYILALKGLCSKVKCSICLCLIKQEVVLPCKHTFCKECIISYKDAEKDPPCPLCKQTFSRRSKFRKNPLISGVSQFVEKCTTKINGEFKADVLQMTLNQIRDKIGETKLNDDQDIFYYKEEKAQNRHDIINMLTEGAKKKTAVVRQSVPERTTISRNVKTPIKNTKKNATSSKPGYKESINAWLNDEPSVSKRTTISRNVKTPIKNTKKVEIVTSSKPDYKESINAWLNDTQNRFNRLTQTQTQEFQEDESQISINMPSVSQIKVVGKENKNASNLPKFKLPTVNRRARSLEHSKNKTDPPGNQRHSVGHDLFIEAYTSEEINVEQQKNVEKAEKMVIVDLMEDEYLNTLDKEINVIEATLEAEQNKPRKSKRKKTSPAWKTVDRIQKTFRKGEKAPKKLDITLQPCAKSQKNETALTTKREENCKKSQEKNLSVVSLNKKSARPTSQNREVPLTSKSLTLMGTSAQPSTSKKSPVLKLSEEDTKLTCAQKSPPKPLNRRFSGIFDLCTQVSTEKHTEEPKIIDIIHEKKPDLDDDVFTILTQKNSNEPAAHKTPQNMWDRFMNDLQQNIHKIGCSSNVDTIFGLFQTMQRVYSCPTDFSESMGIQTIMDVKEIDIQTDFGVNLNEKEVQVSQNFFKSPEKEIFAKEIQTSPLTPKQVVSTEVQTEEFICQKCVNTAIQPAEEAENKPVKPFPETMLSVFNEFEFETEQTKLTPPETMETNADKMVSQNDLDDFQFETCDLLERVQNKLNKDKEENLPPLKISDTATNKIHTSQKSGPSNLNIIPNESQVSQSQIICTVGNIRQLSETKVVLNDSDRSRFKRIRSNNSDSDCESELKKKHKNKHVRDDISVVFETNTDNFATQKNSQSQNSDNIDYNKYLEDVIQKYDNELANEKTSQPPPKKSKTQEYVDHCDNMIEEATRNLEKTSQPRSEKIKTQDYINQCDDLIEQLTSQLSPLKEISLPPKQTEEKASQNEYFESLDCLMNTQNLRKIDEQIDSFNKQNATINQDNNKFSESMFSNKTVIEKTQPNLNQTNHSMSLLSNNSFRKNIKLNQNERKPLKNKDVDALIDDFNNTVDSFDENIMDLDVDQKQEKKINILQNVTLVPPPVENTAGEEDLFSDDDDVVESTPQKVIPKRFSLSQSKSTIIAEILTQGITDEILNEDFALPPPPGFEDESCQPLPTTPKKTQHNTDSSTLFIGSSVSPEKSFDLVPLRSSSSKNNLNKSQKIEDSVDDFLSCTPPKDVGSKTSLVSSEKRFVLPSRLSLASRNSSIEAKNPPVRKKLDSSTPIIDEPESENMLSLSPISQSKPRNLIEVAQSSKFNPLVMVTKPSKVVCERNSPMTSTPKQKSILGYMRTSSAQQISLDRSPKVKIKPCIACTRLIKEQIIAISSLTNKKLATYSNSFGPDVTHMIVAVNNKNCIGDHTIKYVLAVASGIWVLSFAWIKECLSRNAIVPEEDYEALDVSGIAGPRISRLTRLHNPLLKNFKIHAAAPFTATTKEEVEQIVKLLGGQTVSNPRDFLKRDNFIPLIVTEAKKTQDFEVYERWAETLQVATVDIEWLSRSVGQYKILSVRTFSLCCEDSLEMLGLPPELLVHEPVSLFTQSTLNSTMH